MPAPKSGSLSSGLACTGGIAAQWQDLLLLARVLIGWTFVMSGWRKLMNIPEFVATMPNRSVCESYEDVPRLVRKMTPRSKIQPNISRSL